MRSVDWSDVYLLTIIALIRFAAWTRSARVRGTMASTLAKAAYQFSRRRRRDIEAHLPAQFDRDQRERIVRGTFHEFWNDVFNLAAANRFDEGVKVRGLEHLTVALGRGRGAILLENSLFGQRIRAKQLLHGRGVVIHQTHAIDHMGGFWTHGETKVRARIVRPLLDQLELQFVAEIIDLPRGESIAFTRWLVQVLQANQALCLSGEGQIGQKRIVLPFLGRERTFATGMISLAKMTGAPILPLFCWRDKAAQTQLMIEPPLDLDAGIKTYAAQLEAYVMSYPEQYRGWTL